MRATVDGLVLRSVDTGESDKLLTVLTAEHGKIIVMAKGARSMRSRLSPLCHIFSYGNMELYQKNGMRWLSGGSVNSSFVGLHSDVEGYALAAYLIEIADQISGEGVAAQELLRMLLNALYLIEQKKRPRELIRGVFQVFASSYSGFMPDLDACAVCGAERADRFYLDVMNGSVRCPTCFSGGGARTLAQSEEMANAVQVILPITETARAAWHYIESAPLPRRFAFDITEWEELEAFAQGGATYLQHHLEHGFEALAFYEVVKETPHKAEQKERI